MHTYLPFNNLSLNAAVLAEKDLAEQIRSGMTIISTLNGQGKGWQWHPSVLMWDKSEDLLAQYILQMLKEWQEQGFRDNLLIAERLTSFGYNVRYLPTMTVDTPWWWGDKKFHASQKAALIRYDREWYDPIFKGKVKSDLPEMWPTDAEGQFRIGPQPSPDGRFDYVVDGRPLVRESHKLTDEEFLFHINTFHKLLGNEKPIKERDSAIFPTLRNLHDRFHSMRLYDTHDHIR